MEPRDGFYAFDPEAMLRADPLIPWPDCAPHERHVEITRALMPGRPVPRGYRPEVQRRLTPDQAREVRWLYRPMVRGHGGRALARLFGVSHGVIWGIVNHRTYRDVEAA